MKRLLKLTLPRDTWACALLAMAAFLWPVQTASAQGVTTGAISGVVVDAQKSPVVGAGVMAIHEPSGTKYEGVTNAQGRFQILGMRVGGPYTVTVFHQGTGLAFEPVNQEGIVVNLGVATDLQFNVQPISVTEEVTVSAKSDTVFSSQRTGAATAIDQAAIEVLPTISRRIDDVTRLSPQSGGGGTFAGQDNRLNNITIDGSYFNNSFGLAGQPGDRTGVAPISLDAIEQVQVSVAPFDVRQGNFVGAGVNAVTRSGTNQFRGSFYHQFRDDSLVGTEAKGLEVDPGTFKFRNTGGWASGPIWKNRSFFFGNFEDEKLTSPGTTFRANTGGEPVAGGVTRVLASDLQQLSSFLKEKFNYDTGPYEGYSHETPARRFLVKVDHNFSDKNKLSVRYNHLNSNTDVLASTSSSLGSGSRRSNTNALNFQNTNYQILENIRSIIGEWNSVIGDRMANNLIAGYTYQDESRASRGTFFPLVDVLQGGRTYTSFGFEPFTPNNELRYKTFQVQDNFTRFSNSHTWTVGASAERYTSENVFFPGSQSVYVYKSLADFYTDANGYLSNPNRTTSPVTLDLFQVRWMNIPGMEKPIQPLEVFYAGAYAQDDWRVTDDVKLTLGLRLDVPFFGDTGFANANADALSFRDENGNTVRYSTAKLPDPNVLWSPRVGFNWNVDGTGQTQVRGGSGVFTGRPAYVWISNQIGNTGVLTGFERLDDTNARPFNPDPNHYKPATVTGDPASSYELALTDPDFKFPQVWRSNIAVDRRLFGPWSATGEFLYNRDVNGVYYINANMNPAIGNFTGADNRLRFASGTAGRINPHVANAIVLKNENEGRSWNAAGSVERRMQDGLWLKAAYSYGESRNTVDPGSIAFGSWNNNEQTGDPNNPGLGFSANSPGHRVFVSASYSKEYFSIGGTTVTVYWEARNAGNTSYRFDGDVNGDGGRTNDLLYIPRDESEMNFVQNGSFTPAAQAAAWNAYIEQDSYLSAHRGEYAERGAVFLPFVRRMDLSLAQDFFLNLGGHRHELQFRADVLNFGNLLNSDWGVSKRLVTNAPLIAAGVDASGAIRYRLRVNNNQLLSQSYESTAGLSDVYRVQFSLRYTF